MLFIMQITIIILVIIGFAITIFKLNKIMALSQEFLDVIEQINVNTTNAAAAVTGIQTRIDNYINAVNTGGMTAEQEAEALALLGGTKASSEALAASLNAMAVDPNNPVTVEVPAPLEATEPNEEA